MYKLTLNDKDYNVTNERYFENFAELRMYFMTLVKPLRGGTFERYCNEICKETFTEEWIENKTEEHIFDYFTKENGTYSSGTIQNGMNNYDSGAIEYSIQLVSTTVDYTPTLAWGDQSNCSLQEVFPQDARDIKIAFDKFIDEISLTEDCVDAYRIGLALSQESMKEYDTYVSCCGSTDIGKEVNGVLYMFGCNYGH